MAGKNSITTMKNNTIIYIVSGVISAILLVYLLINLDWKILRTAFSNIQWHWLILALLAYFINIALRAIRFSNLIYTQKIHWLEIVPVSAVHNIMMYLLPAKTGDVAYIFLAKNKLNLSLTEGTTTLLAARFYDFSVVALTLTMLLPFARSEMPEWIFQSAFIYCVLVLSGAIGILIFLKITKNSSDHENIEEHVTRLQKIKNAWNKFITGLREIQSHGAHAKIAILTAGIWLCLYSNFYFAAKSIGLPVSFYHIIIISIVMIPLTLLPLQGFANIGTHEIGWASVLIAFNYPYQTALTIAAGSHFVLLISVLLSGGLAFFVAQWILKNKEQIND